MTIGIVAGDISERPAGLERYLYELISHLASNGRDQTFNLYVKSGSGRLAELFSDRPNVRIIPVGWGKWWKEIGLRFATPSDVYIFTGPAASLTFWPRRSIVIAYDFGYKYFSNSFGDRLKGAILDVYSRKSFRSAEKIVCLSQETKQDLAAFFKVAGNKARVIYPGYNHLPEGALLPNLPEGQFFLFAGTIKERKNVANIIKGFEAFLKASPAHDARLVIAGKYDSQDPYCRSLSEYVSQSAYLKDKVSFLGRVTDEALGALYRRAIALVYPSFVEGFGLPILEAMDAGLPVITSDKGATKETAGDAALLVDPYSPADIGRAMEETLNSGRREELISKGRENIKRFSWDRMAKEFLALTS